MKSGSILLCSRDDKQCIVNCGVSKTSKLNITHVALLFKSTEHDMFIITENDQFDKDDNDIKYFVIETSYVAGSPQVGIFSYKYFLEHQQGVIYLRQPLVEFSVDVLTYYRTPYNTNIIELYKTLKKKHKKQYKYKNIVCSELVMLILQRQYPQLRDVIAANILPNDYAMGVNDVVKEMYETYVTII